MSRRSKRVLRSLYASRKARPTSRADGPGYLYAFVDHSRRWKIGMSKNFHQRRRQWNIKCRSPGRNWLPPLAVKRRRRADRESIALSAQRLGVIQGCNTHREIFLFNSKQSIVWKKIIRPILRKAATE
ncbi:hypothetical protein FB446DRAFT_709984 [Lentinula raphanica]|nr:hypothetical protein FB446DRAFT_709984 [Lentinula raphanica]KAJ3816400.1 hypothetical protein F5880DRAFT_1512698 [Lentinula raphanica]